MHTLWERPQSSCSTRNIVACLDETRRASTAGIPDDPIAFIYAFAEQCYPAPTEFIQEQKGVIIALMHEMADVMQNYNKTMWTSSRKRCVWWTCFYFEKLDLVDEKLLPILKGLLSP